MATSKMDKLRAINNGWQRFGSVRKMDFFGLAVIIRSRGAGPGAQHLYDLRSTRDARIFWNQQELLGDWFVSFLALPEERSSPIIHPAGSDSVDNSQPVNLIP
jgi:hypothetical protein